MPRAPAPAPEDTSHITCFECDKKGHYARDCPSAKSAEGQTGQRVHLAADGSDANPQDGAAGNFVFLAFNPYSNAQHPRGFDSTRGYPGEGPSTRPPSKRQRTDAQDDVCFFVLTSTMDAVSPTAVGQAQLLATEALAAGEAALPDAQGDSRSVRGD